MVFDSSPHCGDGPQAMASGKISSICSLHPRGWSHRVVQGFARRDMCSPHPRGSSLACGVDDQPAPVLPAPAPAPAPAGMVPDRRTAFRAAGSVPRARGDGPEADALRAAGFRCSAHPRGCSRVDAAGLTGRSVLPAPAGMVPTCPTPRRRHRGAPRTRGDGPQDDAPTLDYEGCSPRPRGWPRP
jgi:hypothetical protein